MTDHITLRRGVYHDSVTLLRISQAVSDAPGVTAAQVAMATPLNVELAVQQGFSVPEAGPDDLLIAIRGGDELAVQNGLAALQDALHAAERASVTAHGAGRSEAPRTVRAAARTAPDASIVLLSVPGASVAGEAWDAIAAGRHVMIFSDNVPPADEIALKDAGARAGVLVMGPDCGTAVVGGVGLGFANVLRPPVADRPAVGIVAASGTGAQQLSCLLDEAGIAVSHVLGVGGRDLSEAVGGRSTLAALALLDADPSTGHIVVLSKPPHPSTAAAVLAAARAAATPVTTVLLGQGGDLTAAAEEVAADVGVPVPRWPQWLPDAPPAPGSVPGVLRGLFSGGTLADEAMLAAGPVLGEIRSNIPLRPELALPVGGAGVPDLAGLGHAVLDLGDDAFTAGRPHPMIDPSVRLGLIAAIGADTEVGVLLLDVVLGHGADPDPAGRLAPALRAAVAARDATHPLAVVVSLCGTAGDPQGRDRQAAALVEAGAAVYSSNAEAARKAAGLLVGSLPDAAAAAAGTAQAGTAQAGTAQAGTAQAGTDPAPVGGAPVSAHPEGTSTPHELLAPGPAVITAGIDVLAQALRDQAVEVTAVDFRPAAIDPADTAHAADPAAVLAALGTVLNDPRRTTATAEAARRMTAVRAMLIDVLPAADALGLGPGEFLHAGPPITWERASGPLRGALTGAMLLEGLAADAAEAQTKLAAGEGISLSPCHDHHAVGPMAGVVSPSMWVFRLVDPDSGAEAFCTLNEGLGKVLRYGAYGDEVVERLRWMSRVLGPALAAAVRGTGPVDITAIVGQMVQMGDEGHNRNRAGTLMFLRQILPGLVTSGFPAADIADVAAFLGGNDHFFLNLVMPCGKLMGDAAAGVPGATIVTAMCRNGTDFAIRVSGTGDRWFTGPAKYPQGLFLAGFGPDDANPDIGDSAITETMGIGGMVMAGAPAIVRLVGGSVSDALATTARMYEITETENPAFALPILEFRGSPTGIDVTRVLRTGILPQINTGMAGRVAGTGQVGAGLVTPPMKCFTAAVLALADLVPPPPHA